MTDNTAIMLEEAILFAASKHSGQFRKGNGEPYILHPISVLLLLNKYKKSKNQFLLASAAVLHDVVEDCDISIEEIATKFGYRIASIVDELTSDKEAIKSQGKDNYLLDKMLNMSTYALCIKLCDRYHNLTTLTSMADSFVTKQKNSTRFILEGLNSRKLTKTHKKIIKDIKKLLK
jgi:GTP pyrophosphokinase